jgi:hypothetical protein
MAGEESDVAATLGAPLTDQATDQDQSGELMDITSPESTVGKMKFQIGPRDQWEATLPLSPTEAFIATLQQRVHIGRVALDRILAEIPESRHWGFSMLRDEIMKLTGLHDPAASLAVFARRNDLKGI